MAQLASRLAKDEKLLQNEMLVSWTYGRRYDVEGFPVLQPGTRLFLTCKDCLVSCVV